MSTETRKKALIFIGLALIACFAFWWLNRAPVAVEQARNETDAAVTKLEQTIKSHGAEVERIVAGAKKEVTAKHDEIRKNVDSLDSDAVAVELNALLGEYRRERDGGD